MPYSTMARFDGKLLVYLKEPACPAEYRLTRNRSRNVNLFNTHPFFGGFVLPTRYSSVVNLDSFAFPRLKLGETDRALSHTY